MVAFMHFIVCAQIDASILFYNVIFIVFIFVLEKLSAYHPVSKEKSIDFILACLHLLIS